MNKLKLLIIDDEENMRHMLTALLERHGYEIKTAEHGRAALELVAEKEFDFILCDVKMPVMDGLQFLSAGREQLADTTVIMMSAFGTVDLALEAMKAGAYDFISKPFKSDEVLMTLKKAEEREQLRRENIRLKQQLEAFSREASFSEMIGVSQGIKAVFELARKVGCYDTTVLITGESGTGKELVAKGIHEHSPRKNNSFVAINCGSLPEGLLESELFGHVKGAFTGADSVAKGLFLEADGGTIFLDEIAELPMPMQVKLLRTLQEQEIRPVGASRSSKVDVRVLAATARDLEEWVRHGQFREDLFYRLNVVRVRIPPLRERKEDIDCLCHHFIKKFNASLDTSITGFSPEARRLLLGYDWPGNIRELENVVQRGMVTTDGLLIGFEHLPAALQVKGKSEPTERILGNENDRFSIKKAQKVFEKRLISEALTETSGNKSRAAQLLEISYPSLLSKIKEYKIL